MTITINKAYVQSFEGNLRMLSQQGQSLLRQFVTEKHESSLMHNWDRLGKGNARAKTSARMVSPAGGDQAGGAGTTAQLLFSRRRTSCTTFDAGEIIEAEDPSMMLADPTTPITATLANAMKRKVDDIIISAANDPAIDGDGVAQAFPAGQIVGSATTIISVDLLLSVQQLFLANDVDPDEEKILVISPTQYRTLMNIDKVTHADYQMQKALATGYLPNFLGFTHTIISNRLGNTTTPPTAGQIYCLAFTRKGIGLHIAKDIWAEVGQRTDLSFAWQLYTAMTMAAVRVEDEHVCRIWLKDAQS